MSSIPISKEGFQALEQELDRLKKERPHVIQAIKEAREEGDLKENAGYDAARERQGMLEARIKYIESRMALFNVIDLSTLSSEKAILFQGREADSADGGYWASSVGAGVQTADTGDSDDSRLHDRGNEKGLNTRKEYGEALNSIARKGQGTKSLAESRGSASGHTSKCFATRSASGGGVM